MPEALSAIRHPGTGRGRRRLAGAGLFLLVVVVLAALAVPIWLVQPFSPQTPEGLAVSYALRRWAPLGTVVAVAASLALAVLLWRNARWWSRAAIVLALALLLGAAWQARQNLYEKMFAPITATRSVPASEASWVEDADPVLALTLNGEAAAYPVRQIAYHHIVQDVVGGVPVAVTY